MYYLPNFDKKFNYQLYLLIYGEHRTTWYEEFIPKIQEFINYIHNELKNCKCPISLLFTASIITFFLCGVFVKILNNLYRPSDQYENLQMNALELSSDSIERNEEFIGNSDIISLESFNPVIKEEIHEFIEFQNVEACCHEIPSTKECILEGYKMFVVTINLEDLSSQNPKINIINDQNFDKLQTIDQVQPLIIDIIENVLTHINEKTEGYLEINKKTVRMNSMLNKPDSQDQKCCEHECRTTKVQSGSKIPLLLKSRQQRQFINKNVNDP